MIYYDITLYQIRSAQKEVLIEAVDSKVYPSVFIFNGRRWDWWWWWWIGGCRWWSGWWWWWQWWWWPSHNIRPPIILLMRRNIQLPAFHLQRGRGLVLAFENFYFGKLSSRMLSKLLIFLIWVFLHLWWYYFAPHS